MNKCVYIFGNEDLEIDNSPYKFLGRLVADFADIKFVKISPNSDLPLGDRKDVIIIDTVLGIDSIKIFTEDDLSHIELSPRNSVHDFDLGFQLKYLTKIGKLKNILIVGLPVGGTTTYDQIHETLRKLVAQDMQGS